MDSEERIDCPIFQKQEPVIKRLTEDINNAKDLIGKIRNAEELLSKVNTLLDCTEYKEKDPDCNNCHWITNLRRETAELIIKAKKLTKKG